MDDETQITHDVEDSGAWDEPIFQSPEPDAPKRTISAPNLWVAEVLFNGGLGKN